jgi:hypothetical protein
MQRGHLLQTTKYMSHHPASREGMVVLIKVIALLAGYALFVWVTMTQLEQKYLASAAPGLMSREQPVPGPVAIPGRSPASVGQPPTSVRFEDAPKP